MPATADLHAMGQSIWLDNITREMLNDGTIAGFIETMSVTGLTSNPSIFQKAIAGSHEYDDSIRKHMEAGASFSPCLGPPCGHLILSAKILFS